MAVFAILTGLAVQTVLAVLAVLSGIALVAFVAFRALFTGIPFGTLLALFALLADRAFDVADLNPGTHGLDVDVEGGEVDVGIAVDA